MFLYRVNESTQLIEQKQYGSIVNRFKTFLDSYLYIPKGCNNSNKPIKIAKPTKATDQTNQSTQPTRLPTNQPTNQSSTQHDKAQHHQTKTNQPTDELTIQPPKRGILISAGRVAHIDPLSTTSAALGQWARAGRWHCAWAEVAHQ